MISCVVSLMLLYPQHIQSKWSFVFAIVSKFLKSLNSDTEGYQKSIMKDWPSLAQPRRSDYLAMSDAAKSTLKATEDEYGLRVDVVASSLDFARALEEVGRQRSLKKSKVLPWQSHALTDFPSKERWIFGGKSQKLWPYGEHADSDASLCILYPDLFEDPGFEEEEDANREAVKSAGASPRWNETMWGDSLGKVNAALPLAKALGAFVTPHLHSGVTVSIFILIYLLYEH